MKLKAYIAEGRRGIARELALALGISTSYLSQLASGDSSISPERGVAIERATERAVTRQEMFPDNWRAIWPELVSPQPVGPERATAMPLVRKRMAINVRAASALQLELAIEAPAEPAPATAAGPTHRAAQQSLNPHTESSKEAA